MNLEIFTFGAYGLFVWPAFIFTFVSLLILYLKTKKALKKQEQLFFIKYKQAYTSRSKSFKEQKITKEVLSGSAI